MVLTDFTICVPEYMSYSETYAGRLGFEPRFIAPKAIVLPLNDLPILSGPTRWYELHDWPDDTAYYTKKVRSRCLPARFQCRRNSVITIVSVTTGKGVKRMGMLKIATMAVAGLAAVTPVVAGGYMVGAAMTGAQEAPVPGDPDGSGTFEASVNQGTGEVCYTIHVTDITLPATGAHIHYAPPGESGPVVVALSAPDENGHASGCVEADKSLLKEIRKESEAYYVNVHTVDYPGGAVRGQL